MEDWNLISSGNKTKILQCENTTISTLHVLIPEGLLRRCPWFESSCGRALCTYLATAILSKQHQRLQKAGEDFHFSVLMGGFSPWQCDTLFHLHAMIPALDSALCHDLEGRKEGRKQKKKQQILSKILRISSYGSPTCDKQTNKQKVKFQWQTP